MTREREDELGIFEAPNCLVMMQWSWWEGAKAQGNRGQREPLTQISYHPRWCWSGSPAQYLVHLIHVLEVDQCLVWVSLGVRLPVWVGFVVTATSSFFFFWERERERERERKRLGVILDYLLMAMGSSFWLFVVILDFFVFGYGELSPINCVKLAWSIVW